MAARRVAAALLAILATVQEAHSEQFPLIVDVSQLERMLRDDARTVIVDARARRDYDAGHIPMAVSLPSEQSFDPESDRTRIASLSHLRRLLGAAGIHNEDRLVIYDDGILKEAAHLFWTMETYGHDRVSVLDGGFPAWLKAGGAVSTQSRQLPETVYVPSMSPHRLATKLTTRLALHNDHVILVDSRNQEEYGGIVSRASRAGHIPTAVSIPWTENLTHRDGVSRVKPRQQLEALYADLDKEAQIITYCNRGKESALSYLMLRQMGYRVAVYDGAWLEWGNDFQLPIAVPDTPPSEAGSGLP